MPKQVDEAALDKLLQKTVPLDYRNFLLEGVPRLEQLLPLISNSQTSNSKLVVQNLSRMYQDLNRQLGKVCEFLGYPPRQWEWNDSEPVSLLAKIYSAGLFETEWFQRQLGMIVDPKPHPWYTIITT